jgi:hypothetical protein
VARSAQDKAKDVAAVGAQVGEEMTANPSRAQLGNL